MGGVLNKRLFLIYLCFFLSGAAGLIYEVVWARQLSLFLGITSYAHTAVIAAYMLGLASGSWWIGRHSDRLAQPLRFYAWLEVGIGLFAAATPWLFVFLQQRYAQWAGVVGVVGEGAHLTRFTIALVALLLPTFLMGGTLPLLVRGVTASLPQLGRVTGRLYGLNTLGATLGAAAAGFVLLPRFGVTNAILVGVSINLGISVVILLFAPRLPVPQAHGGRTPETSAPVSWPALSTGQRAVLLAGFAMAGFSALLTQLAWIRSMVLVVGGSVYAFTITLSAFLAGIGLGSLFYGRWLSRRQMPADRLLLAALLAFLIGLTTLSSLFVIGQLPGWFLRGYEAGWVENFTFYQMLIFALCFAVMFPPTLLMGALFPLLAVTWTASLKGAGRGIGGAYAVNTIGTIFGVLLGGLVLLPRLGIHYSIMLSAGIYFAAATGFWLGGGKRRPLVLFGALLWVANAVWLVPPWDPALMARGVYYHPENYLEAMRDSSLEEYARIKKLLYYKEGIDGTVAVSDDGKQKSLFINGKVDASSTGDLETQVTLGQLGALMHPNPRHALIIGLGSGITASALASQSSLEDITVLEISPEVIEASKFFAEENHHVLGDPRLKLVSADARNYVIAADRQWDLIISEPSNPWISGVSNLFTRDFFHLMKQKLAPGGIMTQWFHLYGLSSADIRTVIRSFSDTYTHVSIWHMQYGDLIMIGSDHVHALDLKRLRAAFADARIGYELRRAGFTAPGDLLRHFLASGDDLSTYVSGAPLNSDDHPKIEFNAPRSMYSGRSSENLMDIVRFIDRKKFQLPLFNHYILTDSGLDALFMDLRVATAPRSGFERVKANWRVWREIVNTDIGTDFGVADERELAWRESGVNVSMQVLRQPAAPDAAARVRTLGEVLSLPMLIFGDMNHATDKDASWMLGAIPGQGSIEIAMLWTCPHQDGGTNVFVLDSNHPDPGPEQWSGYVQAFAARFVCR